MRRYVAAALILVLGACDAQHEPRTFACFNPSAPVTEPFVRYEGLTIARRSGNAWELISGASDDAPASMVVYLQPEGTACTTNLEDY